MTREQLLNLTIDEIPEENYFEIKRILDNSPKPIDGLGRFEDMIANIACAQHTSKPCVDNKVLVVMCSDNGVVEEGITQTGAYVTGLITKNIADGCSIVNYMAEKAHVKIMPVDIGVNGDINSDNIIVKKVAKGTKNFVKEPAMTEEQMLSCVEAGIEIVKQLKEEGINIICTGDVGIGNTATATAVICSILEGDPEVLTGRSSALSEIGYGRKVDTVFEGIKKYGYNTDVIGYNATAYMSEEERTAHISNTVFEMVMNVGGFDIAGLVGIFIGGALYHIPVVVDGIVSAASALAADYILPGCKKYIIGSYMGKEPASEIVFQELGIAPVITAEMFMGEGSGSVMLMPILDMLVNVFNNLSLEEGPDMEQ